LQWVIRPELKDEEKEPYQTRLPVFILRNHGTAKAKYLSADWSIDGKPLDSVFLESGMGQHFSISREPGDLLAVAVKTAKGSQGYGTACSDTFSETRLSDYLGEFDGTNDLAVPLPNEICGSYEVRLLSSPRPAESLSTIEGPQIKVSIRFQDGFGNLYSERFIITSQMCVFSDDVGGSTPELRKPADQSPLNLRGTIRFRVWEEGDEIKIEPNDRVLNRVSSSISQ
jgi:hypothetical protein